MYTIKQVSAMLGIPSVTLRAWENRYQAVVPARTESGYRLYSDEQIVELKWLKDQTENKGLSISQAVLLLKRGMAQADGLAGGKARGFVSDDAVGRTGTTAEAGLKSSEVIGRYEPELTDSHQELLDRLHGLLIKFRSEDARALVDLGFSMFGYDAMVYKVLVKLMIRVGDEWEQGILSVAQEHYISQFVIQRCFSFYTVFPINRTLPKAIAFCPPGEQHHAGLLMFSLFLRKRGLEVLYLGPDTPEDGLKVIIKSQSIAMACVSLTDRKLQDEAAAFIDRLASGFDSLEFVLGGYGFEGLSEPYASWYLPPSMTAWEEWLDTRLAAN